MVAVPNKNLRPQDVRHQNPVPRPPQFIATTPVFINPIFQVPGASVQPNTTVVSQSLTMVGPIQMSTTNIQLSPAPTSTQHSGSIMTNTQPIKTAVGQVQIATSMPSSLPAATLPAPQPTNPITVKAENQGEVAPAQKSSPPIRQPSPHPSPSAASSPFQPPLSSPPCSSPGAVNTIRKSPLSPTSTALVKNRPVSSTGDSQHGSVPLQASHPPSSPAVQADSLPPQTTTAAPKIIPPASSPVPAAIQTAVPAPVVSQAPLPATAQPAIPQAPVVNVVVASSVASSAVSLTAVASAQSSAPPIVPVVAVPGPVQDAPPAASSPVSTSSGAPLSQSDQPPSVPPVPPTTKPVETTQNTAGNLTRNTVSQLLLVSLRVENIPKPIHPRHPLPACFHT